MPRRAVPLRVSDVMVREVVTAGKNTPVKEVANSMYEKKIGSVVVVDEAGRPVGIVTERDLVYVCAKGLSADTPIWMVMTENPVTIAEDAPLLDAVEKMRELNVRHLPVVDKEGKLVGILSVRDVLDLAAFLIRIRE
ncbi:signal-transduction protein [Thermoproteus uzoniensis 768-20]|uniref:Signal-transduction protein n=1 Tax=Thermoproteus uzoniensis (strain 768-20) TaxID=999630 RepID=F2L5L0_THEU7|nr:CBS domain-containing protein [Thermoproteus uzoniensis]AEA12381.1 signal-transduction protein [Thermoproteus uzoniensis 768-20]